MICFALNFYGQPCTLVLFLFGMLKCGIIIGVKHMLAHTKFQIGINFKNFGIRYFQKWRNSSTLYCSQQFINELSVTQFRRCTVVGASRDGDPPAQSKLLFIWNSTWTYNRAYLLLYAVESDYEFFLATSVRTKRHFSASAEAKYSANQSFDSDKAWNWNIR